MAEEQHWQETDLSEVDKQYENYLAGKTRVVKPPDGDSVWRLLPPRAGAKRTPFRLGIYVHFLKDAVSGEIFAVGICPAKTRGERCAADKYVSILKRSGDEGFEELGDSMAAKEHIICNAVRLDVQAPKVEPLEVPVEPYKTLSSILRDRADGIDFTHPTSGKNSKFNRTGKGLGTKYTVRLVERASPLTNMGWLANMIDLDKVFPELEHAQVEQRLAASLAEVGLVDSAGRPVAPADRQLAAPAEQAREGDIEMVYDEVTGDNISRAEMAARLKQRSGR